TGIHLAMQPRRRLVGEQMHRKILVGRVIAQPFGRLEPCGMRRQIMMAEWGDALRADLDLPRRGFQRVLLRIGTKLFELHEPFRPELLESRQPETFALGAGAHALVDELTPAHLVAAFAESGLVAEP